FVAAGWYISGKGEFTYSASLEHLEVHAPPIVLILAGLFTFFVPMHLIGVGTGPVGRGVNPGDVGKCVAGTHGYYLFLFVLVALYATIYGLAASAVAKWFAGVLHKTSIAAGAGNVVEAALGLLGWGAVIGFGFYGIYLLGRLHGLFARQFRKQLAFFD